MRLFTAALAALMLLGAAPAPHSFDATQRAQILTGISSALSEYIFPDVARHVRAGLAADRGHLTSITDPHAFALAVSKELHALGNDKHLNLLYLSDLIVPDAAPSAAEIAHDRKAMALDNGDVRDAKWLPGDIGYIRIDGFPDDTPQTRRAIDAAMAMVSGTDALIIDLRHNGGGDPVSLDYWMGYFFAKPVELTGIKWAVPKPHLERQFSAAHVGGTPYLKPIYVLTSSRTFSCAEQFTYDMKALQRATIVGETTGGGANPGDFHRLTDHFAVFIPTGQAYNPYTKSNWEHTGIAPDVSASAGDALVTAYTRALKSDTNAFDVVVDERTRALKDPATTLQEAFTP